MDSLEEPRATEYERRASRRLSRGVSIHDSAVQTCGECGQEDLVVADGFHQPVGSESGTSDGEPATDGTTASSSSTTDEAETDPEAEVEVEIEAEPESEAEAATQSDTGAADDAGPSQSGPEVSPAAPETLEPPIVHDRPRSIAKPPEPADLFALRHDGAISTTADVAAVADGNSHPSSIPVSEPVTPSGPSLPYDIYAQRVGLTRTMSATTVTTMTAPASPISEYPPTPTSPLGPSHPYGMYPQTTTAGPSNLPLHGPVGFQGMPDNYQRRVGPDGEVLGDMIGPDGHTEQLPPYSRYPDEASVRRARDVAASSANALAVASSNPSLNPILNSNLNPNQTPNDTSEQPQSPISPTFTSAGPSEGASPTAAPGSPTITPAGEASIPPVPGAGGIGLAARNPEFDSDNGRESSRSQHSSRSFTSESENSGQRINGGRNGSAGSAGSDGQQNQEAVSEKETNTRRGKLQQYARRRLWGIVPYWATCFFVALVVFIGIVTGAVVGTFMEGRNKKAPTGPPAKHGGYSGTVSGPPIISVTVDASPIPTPTDLPPLATGSFSLPLGLNKSPASCFNDSTQSSSWSCGMWFGSGMTITVDQTNASPKPGSRAGRFDTRAQNTGPGYSVALSCNQTGLMTGNVFWYGQQPPAIPSPLPMEMVSDLSDPSRGPAWFKLVPYDKTVIVQESMLTTRASGPGAAPGAMPTGRSADESEKMRRGKVVRAYGGPPGDSHRKGLAAVGDKPWVCTWPDTLLEVFIYPQQNTTWTKYMQPSSTPPTASASATQQPSSPSALSSLSNQTPPTSAAGGEPSNKGQSPTGSEAAASASSPSPTASPGAPYNPGNWVPPYPRVVKVVERRMARARQAYCRQYEIKPEGNSQPLLDPNGDFVEFNISEEETGPAMVYGNGPATRRRWAEEVDGQGSGENMLLGTRASGSDLSDCGCLWMLT